MFNALLTMFSSQPSKSASRKALKNRNRRLGAELLERRELLTAVPTVPTIVAKDTQVTAQTIAIEWNAAQHATSYNVELIQNNKVVQEKDNLSVAVNTAEFTNVSPNTSYIVVVEAVDSAGTSKSSTSVKTEPAPWQTIPAGPVATATPANDSATEIVVQWKPVTGATNYIIEQQQADGSYAQIKEVGQGETSFTVGNLTPKTTYSFQVIAVDSAGDETAASQPASAKTWAGIVSGSTSASGNSSSNTNSSDNSGLNLTTVLEALLLERVIGNALSANSTATGSGTNVVSNMQTNLGYPNLQGMTGALGQIGAGGNYEDLSSDGYGPYDGSDVTSYAGPGSSGDNDGSAA